MFVFYLVYTYFDIFSFLINMIRFQYAMYKIFLTKASLYGL